MEKKILKSEALRNVFLERLSQRLPDLRCASRSFLANDVWPSSCSAQPPPFHTTDDTPLSSGASRGLNVAMPPNPTEKHLSSFLSPHSPACSQREQTKTLSSGARTEGQFPPGTLLISCGVPLGTRSLIWSSSFFSFFLSNPKQKD